MSSASAASVQFQLSPIPFTDQRHLPNMLVPTPSPSSPSSPDAGAGPNLNRRANSTAMRIRRKSVPVGAATAEAAAAAANATAAATAAAAAAADIRVPIHPIPSMQEAFAESLIESRTLSRSTAAKYPRKTPIRYNPDPQARHRLLLAESADADPPARLWRFRPGQSQHELWKLMAQISFGLHLLLRGVANDKAFVVHLLQSHIDEVDEFLEVALEDLAQLSKDLDGRAALLRQPVDDMAGFEAQLKDATFRARVLDDNTTIAHIVSRTRVLLRQYEQDIAEGSRATRDFAADLSYQDASSDRVDDWRRILPECDLPAVADIFEAMKGNTDGWLNALEDLARSLRDIGEVATRLTGIVAVIYEKVEEIDRKAWVSFYSPISTLLSG